MIGRKTHAAFGGFADGVEEFKIVAPQRPGEQHETYLEKRSTTSSLICDDKLRLVDCLA